MTDHDFESRVAAIQQQQSAKLVDQERLATDLGTEMAARLLELFKGQSREDRKKWPTFEMWLGSRFLYDYFVVHDIFKDDPKLAKMLEHVRAGSLSRGEVSRVINEIFEKEGYSRGINERLNDVQKIGS